MSAGTYVWTRDDYRISTDRSLVDVDAVHQYLGGVSYWAKGIPRDVLERSIAHSICFALLQGGEFAGFARVISDRATIAYVGDVFVLPSHRGKGLSKWLMACVVAHPELQGLRRWMLATADAHGLYAQFAFSPLKAPDRWMERHDPDIYVR